jgi:Metallo-peptidase family M12B Reprolysin-like
MPSFGINVIRVGYEQFSSGDDALVLGAVELASDLFSRAGLFLEPIEHYGISVADSRGREIIDDNGEAEALTAEWTVPNRSIDVFFVRSFVGNRTGYSAIGGPCDKNSKGITGAVVEVQPRPGSGFTLAHELGHYLGLNHVAQTHNLMYDSGYMNGSIDPFQVWIMSRHCFVRP